MSLARRSRRLFSPRQRQIEALIARDDIALFQPFPTTSADRYPALFDALAVGAGRYSLAAHSQLRLRQRGGSAGTAPAPARSSSSPELIPTPAPWRRHARPIRSTPPTISLQTVLLPGEIYDAILALAVFRDGRLGRDNPRASCAEILPFAKVEAGLTRLDAALRHGGYLAIANANFRLSDMKIAAGYTSVQVQGVPASKVIYGPDNRLLRGVRYSDVLFRKRGASTPTSDAPSR